MDVTYSVKVQFPIGADVEQAASGVVRASDERVAVREELDGVDVGFVASKGLDSLAGSNIPQLGKSITSTRDECVLVCGVEADAHDIAQVVGEFDDFLARLNVPFHARHVTRRSQDAAVVDEAAAG